MTSALTVLRGLQIGLSLDDMDALTWGQLMDIIVEQSNDSYKYPVKGTTEDYNRLMGI
jgi:hypothetical protein